MIKTSLVVFLVILCNIPKTNLPGNDKVAQTIHVSLLKREEGGGVQSGGAT